jgi:hypothetical protein
MDDRAFMKLVYKQLAALRGIFGQLVDHVRLGGLLADLRRLASPLPCHRGVVAYLGG